MALRRSHAVVTISGTSGSAATKEKIEGLIDGFYLDYDAAAPSTVDVTVAETNFTNNQTIYGKLNTNTDQWVYPRKPLVSGVDGSALAGAVDFYSVNDNLTFSVAQATDGEVFRFTVLWDDQK